MWFKRLALQLFSESRMKKSTGDVKTVIEFVFYIIFDEYFRDG